MNRTLIFQVVLFMAIMLLLAACLFQGPDDPVPPQHWAKDRGAVVPHDSFPSDCSLCHEGNGWNVIRPDFTFDHAKETGVELAGAHAQAECLRCHNDRGPVATFAQQGCSGCHEDTHRGQLGKNCEACHVETNWRPNDIITKHNETRFPLIGAHAAVSCFLCHPGADVGEFKRAPVSCEACHQRDVARASDPNHMALGWTQNCEQCHQPTSFTREAFVHALYPLTGRHATAACETCHTGGTFQGTPNQCVDCHLNEYNATIDPNHMQAQFPTTCDACHGTSGWNGAFFNHATYPLTGKHAQTACMACHVGGVFQGTPRLCADCHLDEYNATTDPNHVASGFPTACDSCHDTNRWEGAQFNHRFPLRGRHDLACIECHPNPNSFQTFECINCHAHQRNEMDGKHREVRGYSYVSAECVRCHPNGRE
ncbi:MAG: hypothetical protein H6834_15370 [Planctomycetes bacterium]|nr:hypothetical protein [Planctomycetota bacterium]